MSAPLGVVEAWVALPRLIQVSMVNVCNCKLVGLPTTTASPLPSKLNAWPTSPAPKAALPTRVPLLVPATSNVFPFPGHHETRPDPKSARITSIHLHIPALP